MTNSDVSIELDKMLAGFQKTHLALEVDSDPVFEQQLMETTSNLVLLKSMVDRAPPSAKADPEIADCMKGLREAFFLMVTNLAINRL
jgi:hypothetical protein